MGTHLSYVANEATKNHKIVQSQRHKNLCPEPNEHILCHPFQPSNTATNFRIKVKTVFGPLATANRSVLLHPILPTLSNSEALIPEDEVPDIRPNKYTNNDIPVVVHCQQHDKVRHGKLQHMQQRTNRLLQHRRPESGGGDWCGNRGGGVLMIGTVDSLGAASGR
jgi:hypothetical protein